MQNTYQEKIDNLEVNSSKKNKLEGGINFKIKTENDNQLNYAIKLLNG